LITSKTSDDHEERRQMGGVEREMLEGKNKKEYEGIRGAKI
jgi:hypothetical protein